MFILKLPHILSRLTENTETSIRGKRSAIWPGDSRRDDVKDWQEHYHMALNAEEIQDDNNLTAKYEVNHSNSFKENGQELCDQWRCTVDEQFLSPQIFIRSLVFHNGSSHTCSSSKALLFSELAQVSSGIILGMGSANERRCYIVMPPLIGWAHTQNDPWFIQSRLITS